MSANAAAILQIAILVIALLISTPLLGRYMAGVYRSERHLGVERAAYKFLRIDPDADQNWRTYTLSVLGFAVASVLVVYALARTQQWLPLGIDMPPMPASGAWNSAVSFTTNTNWQWYSGEVAAGHLLQMGGFAVQNFVSAATGMAVAVAFARGISRHRMAGRIGNFWTDLVRGSIRILLPIAFIGALLMVLGGVIQSLDGPQAVETLTGGVQNIPGGPVASQEVIKELGTNGGGFFNANSSHPFENPTPWTNLFEIFLILLIPFGLTWTFGLLVGDRRQGVAVAAVMGILLGLSTTLITVAEMSASGTAPELAGAAMEGKETRFGIAGSALFAAATTGTSTGAVNSMHDSYTAAGGGVALFNMMLGEIAPGGVGSGLYGMLVLAVMTVFLCGLMVGRTPEYLGKKIGRHEITLVACYILAMPLMVLIAGAIAVSFNAGTDGLLNQGPHGLSEIMYAVTSATNNNGSAFAGLTVSTPFWNTLLGLCMLGGRFLPIVFVLALAGRFAAQQQTPVGPGTLPTHRPLFIVLLAGVALVVVGLTFVPVLALGPIAEALS